MDSLLYRYKDTIANIEKNTKINEQLSPNHNLPTTSIASDVDSIIKKYNNSKNGQFYKTTHTWRPRTMQPEGCQSKASNPISKFVSVKNLIPMTP